MPDEATVLNALVTRWRAKIADSTLTIATVKTYADNAVTALLAGKTIVQLSFDSGGSTAVVNCNPATILAAANEIIAEQGATVGATGVAHIDLSRDRIET